jgi:hypothetical protein
MDLIGEYRSSRLERKLTAIQSLFRSICHVLGAFSWLAGDTKLPQPSKSAGIRGHGGSCSFFGTTKPSAFRLYLNQRLKFDEKV